MLLFATSDGRESGQRCLVHQASKGWTSEAWSQGDVLPSLGHQGHLSPLDVSVEPAWSPASKDAALTGQEVSPRRSICLRGSRQDN